MAIVDIRHMMAGVLTVSMFLMLGNMIKTDYFDAPLVDLSRAEYRRQDLPRPRATKLLDLSNWSKRNGSEDSRKPCWTKPPQGRELANSKGFIIFSLTGGHERHLSQVTNAIAVARHLRAILVLPDVIGTRSGERRKFAEIYDVIRFVRHLKGLVKISLAQPAQVSSEKLTIARVPDGVSEEYVSANVEPLFRNKGILKLVTYFPASTQANVEGKNMNSLSCLSTFEALQLRADLQDVIQAMLQTLRNSSQNSEGLFIAVDLRIEMLERNGCRVTMANGRKSCYSAEEIGQFFKKIGIPREATMYLTLNGWHNSLESLTEIYPNVITKESLIPAEKVALFLNPESSIYRKIIDYYICSWSDIYVPATFDLFYDKVVGDRIAAGQTTVVEPQQLDSENAFDYISPYLLKKSHQAYSCFCRRF